jgi:hypothetical protein
MKWRAVWVFIIGLALLLAVVAALSFTGHAALAVSIWGKTITAVYGCALLIYFIARMSRSYVPPIGMDDPRFLRRRIDEYQRRWRWTILLQVFLMFPFFALLPKMSTMFRVFGGLQFIGPMFFGTIAFLMIFSGYMLSAGPGFLLPGASELINDEFAAALRARVMRFAYILTMLLLGAALSVAVWHPDLTVTAFIWELYAGFAIPALYYVIADWRASGADEDRNG